MADKAKKSGGKKVGYRIRKNPLKTKDAVPYLADVVPVGTANLDTILSEVAESLNITKARARLCFDAMFELIHEELAKGNKVETPFGLMEPAISGSFDAEDAPFDPKRNKVYVKVTPPKAIRDALAKIVPERLDAPSVPLEIASVVTSSLGKKGYNAVRVGEAFAVSGQGLSDAVQVALVDKSGVRHEVAGEEAKETLLLCGAVSAAAKGAATLEVSVASSSSATGRFTVIRRVKVF